MSAVVLQFETLRTLAFGSLSTSYAALGTPITHSLRMFRIINSTNADLNISLDGTNDHMLVPATSFVLYDVAANGQNASFRIQNGSQFYAKIVTGGSASSGQVALECIYARGE